MEFSLILYALIMFGMLFLIVYIATPVLIFKMLNYKLSRTLDRWFGGHISFLNITIYGRNAMRWEVNIRTKKYGYICFNLPIPIEGKIQKFYYYLSPNGTPWASTYYRFGNQNQRKLSKLRKEVFGHNFNVEQYRCDLSYINVMEKLPINLHREITIDNL